jgi:DNA-binding transcriptional regulator YhcF (GntR family)
MGTVASGPGKVSPGGLSLRDREGKLTITVVADHGGKAMAPSRHDRCTERGVDRVRAQILTALHFGRLGPGDRAPSVRRLADQTGMNRKTVHRAYRKLASEGLLDLRPGSGTFIAEKSVRSTDDPATADLIAAINRCRSEAGLGVRAQPVLLDDLIAGRHDVRSTLGVVTTDCHWSEVVAAVEGCGLPVCRVALDAEFSQTIARAAGRGTVVLAVRDPRFAPAFRRLLRQLSVPSEHVDRLVFVGWGDARRILQTADPGAAVYVSPPLGAEAEAQVNGERRIKERWHIAPGSIDRLRARLALDAAQRARAGH